MIYEIIFHYGAAYCCMLLQLTFKCQFLKLSIFIIKLCLLCIYIPPSQHKSCLQWNNPFYWMKHTKIRETCQKKYSGNNEFGTISFWTPPPTINSEKSNSENWSVYIPSLPTEIVNKITNFDNTISHSRELWKEN